MDKVAPSSRRAHVLPDGRVAYEWDQTIDEVNVYIRVPDGARARDLDVTIASTSVRVGIVGNPPYLEHELAERVRVDDSVWTWEEGELAATLAKSERGKAWSAPFAAHAATSDERENEEDKRRLMLERFQMENPGFDFSGASFNGQAAPDASTFMGGISHR